MSQSILLETFTLAIATALIKINLIELNLYHDILYWYPFIASILEIFRLKFVYELQIMIICQTV